MRVCDRCGSKAVAETFTNQRYGNDTDLCAPCATAFSDWLQSVGGPESRIDAAAEQAVEEVRRKRGRPPGPAKDNS
jgi:hypothetical protein